MVLRYLVTAFVVIFCLLTPVFAEEPDNDALAEEKVVIFPGPGELGSRSSALADFVAKAEERLTQLSNLSQPEQTLVGLKEQMATIKQQMESLGAAETWYIDRINNFLSQVGQLRQQHEGLQQRLANRQFEIDMLRTQALQDQKFWQAWEADLKTRDIKLPGQSIDQVEGLLKGLLKNIKSTTDKILLQQEKTSVFQRELQTEVDSLNNALGALRKATFRRNAYSFFSKEFLTNLSNSIDARLRDGAREAMAIDRSYLRANAWLGVLLVAIFAAIARTLFRYRSRLEETQEWSFILKRPLAAASFFSVVFCWLILPPPPAQIRFLLAAISVVSAITLALPLMKSRQQKQFLMLAAGVFLVTGLLQLISLPQALYRVYTASLAILLIPLLNRQIDHSRTIFSDDQGRRYRALLRLTILVLSLSLVAQMTGFMNFSAWLTQATFETGIVLLLTHMAVLLSSGASDLGVAMLSDAKVSFFSTYGTELSTRLKRLLKCLLYAFAFFYLLPVWRFFTTYNESWAFFTDLGFDVGGLNLSLYLLLLAIFAFYLSLQVSWIVQAFTESQVLDKRMADRGVRDAVKKLIHYSIVLIGLFIAMGMLGIEFQNFMVLLGAFGVGIGFGLQDIVNNFLSGLILLFERPIRVGDGVLIDGEYGTVERIGMRSTVVRNLNEAELIVPNSNMISQKVTNLTHSNRQIRIVVTVGVAYGSDLEKVLRILSEAAQQHQDVLVNPKPMPLFIGFGASSLDFELRVWIGNIDNRPRVSNELLLFMDKRFREEAIEIPFPQRDLHIRSLPDGMLDIPSRSEGGEDPLDNA